MFYGNKVDNKKLYFGLNFRSNVNCVSSIYVIYGNWKEKKTGMRR